MRRAVSAALAVGTLVAGCGGGGEHRGSDPERVIAAVTDYAHAFGAGDGEKACSLLTPAGRAALTARVASLVGTRDCAEAVQKLQALAGPNVTGPFKEAKASNARTAGDHATATLVAGGHSTQVSLEKQDGDWLLTKAPGT